MVKNLGKSTKKFYMYPRFIQLLMDTQFTEKKIHQRTYPAPSHAKKIFANMKRVGRLFRKRNTVVSGNVGTDL